MEFNITFALISQRVKFILDSFAPIGPKLAVMIDVNISQASQCGATHGLEPK